MSKKVVFKVDNEGNIHIDDVNGYGSSCKDFTKSLEDRLGGADESTRKLTEEFDELPEADIGERVSNG